jgi:hypothetical protein
MKQTIIRKKSMRNTPTSDVADFSDKLNLRYSTVLESKAFTAWVETAVAKVARQGKRFELTNTIDGVRVTVYGTRK